MRGTRLVQGQGFVKACSLSGWKIELDILSTELYFVHCTAKIFYDDRQRKFVEI